MLFDEFLLKKSGIIHHHGCGDFELLLMLISTGQCEQANKSDRESLGAAQGQIIPFVVAK